MTIGNTIVAGNTAATSGPDAFGTFASQGNNLIGETDGSSGWVGSDLTGTVAQPLDPLLAPLAYYGGPTQTMALLPGSPAIDAGNNALIPAGVTTDQRGFARIVNGTVDIGAFEAQSDPAGGQHDRRRHRLPARHARPARGGRPGQYPVRSPDDHVRPDRLRHAQTITLTQGQLELSNTSGTETITGPAAGVTVSGGGLSRVFQVDSGVTADLERPDHHGRLDHRERRRPVQRTARPR